MNDLIVTTSSLVPNGIYKIKGYKEAEYLPSTMTPNYEQKSLSGYFVRYLTDGSIRLLADNKVNILDDYIILTDAEKFWYISVTQSTISDYTTLRNTLINL